MPEHFGFGQIKRGNCFKTLKISSSNSKLKNHHDQSLTLGHAYNIIAIANSLLKRGHM